MINIKCRSLKPLGELYFPSGVYLEFNIDSTITKPEYPLNEDARDDMEGDQHIIFQRWDKQHKINFMAVESLCDTCSILRLMDEVYINGERVFDVFVDIIWNEEAPCMADISITFSKKKIIKTL